MKARSAEQVTKQGEHTQSEMREVVAKACPPNELEWAERQAKWMRNPGLSSFNLLALRIVYACSMTFES